MVPWWNIFTTTLGTVVRRTATGTTSQGGAAEEAVENLKEATGLYLEEFPQETVFRPMVTTFEVPVYA